MDSFGRNLAGISPSHASFVLLKWFLSRSAQPIRSASKVVVEVITYKTPNERNSGFMRSVAILLAADFITRLLFARSLCDRRRVPARPSSSRHSIQCVDVCNRYDDHVLDVVHVEARATKSKPKTARRVSLALPRLHYRRVSFRATWIWTFLLLALLFDVPPFASLSLWPRDLSWLPSYL